MRPFAIVIVAIVAYAPTSDASIAKSTIGGIGLGDSESTVFALLGHPDRTVHTGDALDPQFEYDGLTIWMFEGVGVAQVRSTNAKYCLNVGVCPGTSVADLRLKLGAPLGRPDIGDGLNEYTMGADSCWLEVAVSNRVVTALEFKCQP